MKATTQAWVWLTAGVMALGVNGVLHDEAGQWLRGLAAQRAAGAASVLAPASSHVDSLLADVQRQIAGNERLNCRQSSKIGRIQGSIARGEGGLARAEELAAREEARLAQLEMNRARIEAAAAQAQFATMGLRPIEFTAPRVQVSRPRLRVSVPHLPVTNEMDFVSPDKDPI